MQNNELEIMFDYAGAGFHVFALHGIGPDGKCQCEQDDCSMAGKHPAVAAWQKTPLWSDEQLQNIADYMVTTGFGVLCEGWLIIDVDPRNGGADSYKKLCADIGCDPRDGTFWVETGGGGWHVYLGAPAGSYSSSLPEYPGIDFKTSGYVVGCGSLHKNGAFYTRGGGFPDDVAQAPESILAMIKRKDRVRAKVDGCTVDVSLADIKAALDAIPNNDVDYDKWVSIGMGAHHATGGSSDGYEMWVQWSEKSAKHNEALMSRRWHSFGKSPNPITLGTIMHMAAENGYQMPVTFDAPEIIASSDAPEYSDSLPFDTSHCDLQKPPGFVGEVADWICRQGYYPRERLAAISALVAIGNLAGLHWRDDITGATTNLLVLCVAGTGTGKEAVQESFFTIMRNGGMAATVHGDIKSKQEIIRNVTEHQAACYLTDEIGEILKTIENAKKRGGAAYLEGVTGELMKLYTKSNGVMPVSGDVRRTIVQDLLKTLAQAEKTAEDCSGKAGDDMAAKARYADEVAERTRNLLNLIQDGGGLPKPFLSMIGFTTMESMEPALSVDMAKNGFLNRAFIIEERNTNPKPNKRYAPCDFPFDSELARITATGSTRSPGQRIEFYGTPRKIRTEPDAKAMLQDVQDWQWRFAEHHCETTGYEALARRAYEMVAKVSAILAVGDYGIRTKAHVEWAATLVKRDIDEKIRLIRYVESNGKGSGLQQRIISLCQEPVYESSILNRMARSGTSRVEVMEAIALLETSGTLRRDGKRLVVADF